MPYFRDILGCYQWSVKLYGSAWHKRLWTLRTRFLSVKVPLRWMRLVWLTSVNMAGSIMSSCISTGNMAALALLFLSVTGKYRDACGVGLTWGILMLTFKDDARINCHPNANHRLYTVYWLVIKIFCKETLFWFPPVFFAYLLMPIFQYPGFPFTSISFSYVS